MMVLRSPTWTKTRQRYDTETAKANLRLSLLEAVCWSAPRADPRDPEKCLRTPSLAPYLFNDSRHSTLHDVASARHRELEQAGIVERLGGRSFDPVDAASIGLGDIVPTLRTGRLLVWERDATVDDGVGQHVTGGYLDRSDMPPWDTWIAYVDFEELTVSQLISWVPPAFVQSVSEAIRVNTYEALYWATDARLGIRDLLKEEGLLA